MTDMTPNDWGNKYLAMRGTYESFTVRLKALLADLLQDAEVDIIQIEGRAKDVESFVEKISRKGSKYKNPLTEITDLVGLRIITYYLEDVQRVGAIIANEFQVDEANSVDKTADLGPDRFGYSSVHYVVTLSPDRQKLAEWKPFAGLTIEIQVRTALQHAWSAVNHKLDYKSTIEVPPKLRRRLFRLSALFELADEQFSELRDERTRISAEYAEDVRGGRLNIPVDEASITAYIQDSGKRDRVLQMIAEGGGNFDPDIPSERVARDRSDLLQVLNWAGISSIEQLDEYLTGKILPKSLEHLPLFENYSWTLEDALTTLILTEKRAGEIYDSFYYDVEDFAKNAELWHSEDE